MLMKFLTCVYLFIHSTLFMTCTCTFEFYKHHKVSIQRGALSPATPQRAVKRDLPVLDNFRSVNSIQIWFYRSNVKPLSTSTSNSIESTGERTDDTHTHTHTIQCPRPMQRIHPRRWPLRTNPTTKPVHLNRTRDP